MGWIKSILASIIVMGGFGFIVYLCLSGYRTQQQLKDKTKELVEQAKDVPEQLKEQYFDKKN